MPTPLAPKSEICDRNEAQLAHERKGGGNHADEGFPTILEMAPKNPDRVLRVGSLAQRRNQTPPPPINTITQVQQSHIHHSRQESISGLEILPEKQPSEKKKPEEGDRPGPGSSGYMCSGKTEHTMYTTDYESPGQQVNRAILNMYNSWSNIRAPDARPEYPKRHQSLMKRQKRSQSTPDPIDSCSVPSPASDEAFSRVTRHEVPQHLTGMIEPSPQFSPLPLYFRGQNFPSTRKGEKTMIGQNGWLECTGKADDDEKKPQVKKLGFFLNSIKKIAKDVTAELNTSNRRSNLSSPDLTNSSHVTISLDAREQSLLYCELEFHLTSAMNDYITAEFEKGHLLPDNLKKTSDSWIQQGRPRVISFRYDLETQLELVALHLKEFNFYGRRQNNPAEIMGLLHSMKVNARAMRVRTFCQPDSVIAKQLIDSQSLFDMMNVSNAQQLALAEIGRFFRMIVERECAKHEPVGRHTRSTIPGSTGWQNSHHADLRR
ncbi:hypothetical protein X797_002410 [Metarhizium robertsii]|uniref:Uncharacterized protein n=2 Tax=Metarhizium robertsii TaxID=568076 RepID=E9EZ57_METRA|nr:uncharacterized protein MAA_05306 [Metarhizium robertsii ARSEF 23]EFY99248.1 hypothetical protein MAA_05306 [Metarhizium robertsii ARSEF 23]EXV04728.1 hypothetical protein X797_002410 [Metarhizium robertsii]